MSSERLDLDALRTFVLACDLGGFARAADRRDLTASAVSVQMKRLQAQIGTKLFRKRGRGVALTETGELVLAHARRLLAAEGDLLDSVRASTASGSLRLGFSQDFVDSLLPGVLARASELFPRIRFEVEIDGHSRLSEAVVAGRLDLALSLGLVGGPAALPLGEVDLLWIAGPDFTWRGDEQLPLVVLGPGCAMRARAVEALEAGGIDTRVAATSPSLSGLWATTIAGLGVTIRTRIGLPPGLLADRHLLGLPALGPVPVVLHVAPRESRATVRRVREEVEEAVATLLRATTSASAVRTVRRTARSAKAAAGSAARRTGTIRD